ncbi:TolC family protein [Myxococcus faecalis]|uniref:TolC family protein n=1 Tax=Myxococcus faecalis TaxID=3115646 RepID=UPI0038D11B7B
MAAMTMLRKAWLKRRPQRLTALTLGMLGVVVVPGTGLAGATKGAALLPGDAPTKVALLGLAQAGVVPAPAETAAPPKEPSAPSEAVPTDLGVTRQAQPEVPSVSLEEAIARALKTNPAVAQSEGNVTNAAAAERSAVGAYIPTLSASASGSLSSTQRVEPVTGAVINGSADNYSAGLSTGWNVFTGGQRSATREQTKAQSGAASAQLRAQRASAVLEVQRAYYEVLRGTGLENVARSRIERARQNEEAAQRRLAVGSATRSDLLRAQLDHTTARDALRTAETQRASAALALGRLIGAEGAVEAKGTENLDPKPLAVSDETLVSDLEAQAPAVLAAASTLSASAAGVDVAKATYLPTVRLSAGYDWFNQDPSFNGGRTSWNVRLGLSYPIFDGFLREERVQRAKTAEVVSQVQLADTRRAVRTGAHQALNQLRLSADRIGLSEQSVEVAREDLKVQEERYRLGATTILELLTSQENLVQAEINLVSSRFDYRIAHAELEALAGRQL